MPAVARKTVKVEELRKILGEKEADKVLSELFGPKVTMGTTAPLKIEKETFSKMLSVSEGQTVEGFQIIPAVIRLYWRESPHARARFALWLRAKLTEIEQIEKGTLAEPESGTWVLKNVSPVAHQPRKKRTHLGPKEINQPSQVALPTN